MHLTVKYALVGILHLLLVEKLLLNLLLPLNAPDFLSLAVLLSHSFLFLLLLDREVIHVPLIDVRLLVQSCTLSSHKALLVRTPGVVLQVGHRVEVAFGETLVQVEGV